MQQNVFHQPDREAIERLLRSNRCSPTGVVLRLAYRQGLTRDEINSLTWEQVDFDDRALRLPKRTVPLEEDTAACLREWQTLYGACDPCVVVSEKFKRRMAPEAISRLARVALDGAGQKKVRLLDLRYDFVLRLLEQHDWPYALRVSGLSVTTYRNCLADVRRGAPPPETAAETDSGDETYKIWKIMQSDQNSPAGIALWLSHQIGLQNEEIVALTWEQADFDEGVLHLAGRDAPMTAAVSRILKAERALRAPEDDPHVILTPRTKKPMSVARLSTTVRTLLIRGGIEEKSLRDLRRDAALEDEKKALLAYAAAHGSISRGEAMRLLDTTQNKAYGRLNALVFDGALVRINAKYYPAGAVVLPEEQRHAVKTYLADAGAAYCQDIAALLHIGKRSTARLLKKMVSGGELVLLRREKQYKLP